MRLLCAFVKNPTKDEILDRPLVIDGELMPTRIREDAQDALFAIGKRSWNQIQIEKGEQFRVNLHGANLTGADLRHSNLDRANLTHAKLADADLEDASVKGACLVGANLTGANLDIAFFTKSICRQARFTRVYASKADFSGADLEGTIWDNANLEGAQLSVLHTKRGEFREGTTHRSKFDRNHPRKRPATDGISCGCVCRRRDRNILYRSPNVDNPSATRPSKPCR